MGSTEQYIVSARKYRPATFETVVGQKALTATLKNAITGGKLAQAYLFCGPRGVGKTSCARIFAKTINCEHPRDDGEACGECESCKAIERGSSFNLVELDAASNNSVDDIRNITEQVYIPPQDGRYRVFIIDEVHMLTNNAFNAFLKTLEEPPKNVVFILATTERHKVIPTILSRCQIYDFRRITIDDIVEHLEFVAQKEGIKTEREALGVIALKADGAMRDALSIFDQVVASTRGNVSYKGTLDALNVLDQDYYFRLVDIFREGDVAEALLTFKEITDKGFDPQFFINGLGGHLRNLMVCADPRTVKLLETSQDWERKYIEQSSKLPVEWYYTAMKIVNDTDFNYRLAGNKKLTVELALIRLSRLLNSSVGEAQPPKSGQQSASKVPQTPSTPRVSQPSNPKIKNDQSSGAPFVKPDGETPRSVPENKKEAAPSLKAEEPKEDKKVLTEFTRGRNNGVRPTSFRLSSETSKISGASISEKRENPFTEEDFRRAWNDYIDSHPGQMILVGAMRGGKLDKAGDATYKVVVEHPAQKQAFESSFSELHDFLKQKLGNDNIVVTVEISDKEEEKGMSPKEFLKMSLKENQVLADFLKEIDGELDQI